MNLEEFKLKVLGIDKDKFKKIYAFVDFGNVNYWFNKDRMGIDDNILRENEKLVVGIEGLARFINLFAEQRRFYYGIDRRKKSTWHINRLAKGSGFKVNSKEIQWIKRYLDKDNEGDFIQYIKKTKVEIKEDGNGFFIETPKCNFDVEIAVDAVHLMDYYDTFALFSGDSDFVSLINFLKKKGKKIILFHSGKVFWRLKNSLKGGIQINAQKIKKEICIVKEIKEPPTKGVRKSDSYPRAG